MTDKTPIKLIQTSNDATKIPMRGTEHLRKVSLFNSLEPVELSRLYDKGVVQTVRAHATVFIEGEPNRGMYILLDGTIMIQKSDSQSATLIDLYEVRPGETLGELSLFCDAPRPYTATAKTQCQLYYIDSKSFTNFLESLGPQALLKFWRHLACEFAVSLKNKDAEVIDSRLQLLRQAFSLDTKQ